MVDGAGLFVGWYDADPDFLPGFNQWHSSEHMPERNRLPGFVSAQRYRSLTRENAYCVLYRTEVPEVFVSEPYLEVLNNPTSWTQRMMPGLLNLNRTLCKVVCSSGQPGCGGHLSTARPAHSDVDGSLDICLLERRFADIEGEMQGLARLELAVVDQVATTTNTNERALRKSMDDNSDWVILVEGYAGETCCSELMTSVLKSLRMSVVDEAGLEIDHFRLDHAIF